MIYSVHIVVRRKPTDYPIKEFEERDEALKWATDCAYYGCSFIVKTLTDDRNVEYPSEEVYINGMKTR